jgi:ABC-type multidrug transport system fused ATPase/permease subunit
VGSLLRNGRRQTLRMCDLWELSPGDEAGPLCDEFERRWTTAAAAAAGDAEASAQASTPSVGRILYSMFARPFWASAALYIGVVVAQFSCAALVREMVSWVLRYGDGGDATAAQGWLICLGLLLLQLLQCVCQSHTDFIMMRGGLRARALLVAITFRRSLGLTVRARVSSHADTGRLVNLMASDSQRLLEFLTMCHRMWTAPLVLVGGIGYIYVLIGPAVFAGVGLMVAFMPVSAKLALRQRALQREILYYTDARVALTADVLDGIRVAKVYAWEAPMLRKLAAVRAAEVCARDECFLLLPLTVYSRLTPYSFPLALLYLLSPRCPSCARGRCSRPSRRPRPSPSPPSHPSLPSSRMRRSATRSDRRKPSRSWRSSQSFARPSRSCRSGSPCGRRWRCRWSASAGC